MFGKKLAHFQPMKTITLIMWKAKDSIAKAYLIIITKVIIIFTGRIMIAMSTTIHFVNILPNENKE